VKMLRLRIPVPESLATNVHNGSTADISVQATGEYFTGTVARSTNALERSTRTEQVEIDVPNKDFHLAPGMYADVVLQVEKHDDALLIPIQALTYSDNRTSILVVGNDNRVAFREVRTGLEDANSAEILSGISEGERVIVANAGSYQNGAIVDPRQSSFPLATTKKGEQ